MSSLKNKIREFVKSHIKTILRIPQSQAISIDNFRKYRNVRRGPRIWTQKITAADIVNEMQKLGMQKGSNVFIHCSWLEFYNYTGTVTGLIDAILDAIGPEGTLIMPAIPLMRKGKPFNVKKSVTKAGILAEEFRKYPNVKRSINVQHSVCALGPQSDYLVSEHHLSETPWDEKSPYYKLSKINALVFSIGLTKCDIGTIIHCVESILRKDVPYFADFFAKQPTTYEYIDVDGVLKTYKSYVICKPRVNKRYMHKLLCDKYFDETLHRASQISNMKFAVSYAEKMIPFLIDLGRKGIVMYKTSTRGYKFEK